MLSISNFENKHVMDIYNKISHKFSLTRGYLWKGVKEFITNLESESLILDAGCGNGKNMFRKDCKFIGIDNSINMVNIVKTRGHDCLLGDIRCLPFDNNMFDAVISVAVIHHIYEYNDRLKCINEMIRVTKPGGQIFIQVWENMKNKSHKFENIKDNDYLVKWDNMDGNVYKRYYHLFDKDEFTGLFSKIKNITIVDIKYEMENWIIIVKKIY